VGDGRTVADLGTENALLLRDGVENLHGQDSRAVLVINDVSQNLVLLVLGLVLRDQFVQILFEHYLLNFAELLEKLLHVVLVEAETVRN